MSRLRTFVETPDWALSADTDNPQGAGSGRYLVSPVVAGWSTDQIPPVATPDTATVQVYDDGLNGVVGLADQWLPMKIGTPIGVYVVADNPSGGTTKPVSFQGRIADCTAVNVNGGGLLFTLICSGRLADWNGTNAPSLPAAATDWLDDAYTLIAADAGLTLSSDDGSGIPATASDGLIPGNAMDNTNVSSGDVLGQLALQDVRGDNTPVSYGWTHYVLPDIDTADPTPPSSLTFYTCPYRLDVLDLAGVMVLEYDAVNGVWTAVDNPDYYTDGGTGVLLDASQVLQDVGSWATNLEANINTVELTGSFTPGPVEAVRVEHSSLVAAKRRQTRTIASPASTVFNATLIGQYILGRLDQVEDGFGLTSATVVHSTLTQEQLLAWGDELWPTSDVARGDGGPLGRPIAIGGIPTDWRLAEAPIVFGRLMGITVTVGVARPSVDNVAPADGLLTYSLAIRALAPAADNSITWDDTGNLPGTDPDWLDLDRALTWDRFSLIGY